MGRPLGIWRAPGNGCAPTSRVCAPARLPGGSARSEAELVAIERLQHGRRRPLDSNFGALSPASGAVVGERSV